MPMDVVPMTYQLAAQFDLLYPETDGCLKRSQFNLVFGRREHARPIYRTV